MLEFDTTDNKFRDDLPVEPLDIQRQVASNDGRVQMPIGPGLGIEPNRELIQRYALSL